MALFGRWIAVAGVVLATGCSPFGGGEFVCMEDTQCTGGPGAGTCEPDGRCSFPDPACTGGRRYGGFAGDKSNTCVGGEIEPDAPIDDDAPDAPIDAMIDASVVIPFCDSTNTTLVGCWEFEGNGTDRSGSNPSNTANTSSATFTTGRVGMGLALTATSLVTTGDRASLEPPNLSFEAWIRPTQLPAVAGERMGVFDSGGAYGLFINNVGTGLFCSMNGSVQVAFTFPTNAWTHVACTNDGANVRVYINGAPVGMGAGLPLTTGDSLGTYLGANSPSGEVMIGTLDQVRFWNVARTPAQICAAAGMTSCP